MSCYLVSPEETLLLSLPPPSSPSGQLPEPTEERAGEAGPGAVLGLLLLVLGCATLQHWEAGGVGDTGAVAGAPKNPQLCSRRSPFQLLCFHINKSSGEDDEEKKAGAYNTHLEK